MNHPRIPTPILDHARTVLEPAQLEAWMYYELGQTMRPVRGVRWVAMQLDLDPSSVNGRLTRAARRLRNAGIWQDASGNWHHNASVRAQEARRREDTPQEGIGSDQPDLSAETLTRKDAA